jgi:ribosomal protein S27E
MPKASAISNKYQQLVESNFAYVKCPDLKRLSRCLHKSTFEGLFKDCLPQLAAAG